MEEDSVVIRPLAKNDAAALLKFYNGLSAASIRTFRPLGDKTSYNVCQEIVNENILTPFKRCDLVCFHGAELVGWAFIENLDEKHPQLGLAVADSLQGKGVGKTLLGQLLDLASKKGINKVYLIAVTDNQKAINLYKNHGFLTYGEIFDEVDQLSYFQMVANLPTSAQTNNG